MPPHVKGEIHHNWGDHSRDHSKEARVCSDPTAPVQASVDEGARELDMHRNNSDCSVKSLGERKKNQNLSNLSDSKVAQIKIDYGSTINSEYDFWCNHSMSHSKR